MATSSSFARNSYGGSTSFVNNQSFAAGTSFVNETGNSASFGGYSEAQLLKIAEKKWQKKKAQSNLLSAEMEMEVPTFHMNEIEAGKVLGRGGFCVVQDICSVNLLEDESDSSQENKKGDERTELSETCTREGKGYRYAVKMVQFNPKKPKVFVRGLVDLIAEAQFLEHMNHPHVIKIRGVASTSPFTPGHAYFVILDKLHETLSTRLNTSWKKRKPARFALMRSKDKHKVFLLERLAVAFDIASALSYLHQKNVVYRDVTPNNVGFDVQDQVKIFDFGLSKELHPSLLDHDGTYKLTGDVGSLRYMAPEIALSQSYNQSADVYSFSILLWQILKIEKPFEIYDTRASFQAKVVQRGARPKTTDPSWHPKLVEYLKKGWDANLHNRPSMTSFASAIDKVILAESGGGKSQEFLHSRSSSHGTSDMTD